MNIDLKSDELTLMIFALSENKFKEEYSKIKDRAKTLQEKLVAAFENDMKDKGVK